MFLTLGEQNQTFDNRWEYALVACVCNICSIGGVKFVLH